LGEDFRLAPIRLESHDTTYRAGIHTTLSVKRYVLRTHACSFCKLLYNDPFCFYISPRLRASSEGNENGAGEKKTTASGNHD
jgi:hypothetical protein